MKQQRKVGMNFGVVTIISIFILLCLTAFSVLALSTVTADKALSERSMEYESNYIAAKNQGESLLFHLDNLLYNVEKKVSTPEQYWNTLKTSFDKLGYDTLEFHEESKTLSYKTTISERTDLHATIQLFEPKQADTRYHVVWEVRSHDDNLDSDTPNLWNGENMP
ncbi:hypothetical protein LJB83_02885 [Clostridia bacterium OttesenSCG-928-F22]|nr:hypothetical protein [Clostridia bacterium OttesenSCG-928-F22]